MSEYLMFPRGWLGRRKRNIPENINQRIKNEKNRIILTRIFKKLGGHYYVWNPTRKNIKNIQNLRNTLSKNNFKELVGVNKVIKNLNNALHVLEPNYNKKVTAVKKIELAYKKYLSKHRNDTDRQKLIQKSKAISRIRGIVSAKRLTRRYLTGRSVAGYSFNWNRAISEMNNIRPKTNKVPRGFTGKNKYERARVYKNRIIQWSYTHPKKYDTPLYRGVQDREAIMFMTQPYVNKVNLSSFSKRLNQARFFSYSTFNGVKTSVILRYSPPKNKNIPSVDLSRNGNFGGYAGSEEEVILVPGTFIIKNIEKDSRGNYIIDVDFSWSTV